MKPAVLLFSALALPALLAPAARAQDETRTEIALQNQILELRHDLDALRDQIAASGGASGAPSAPSQPQDQSSAPPGGGNDLTATLLDRVSRLEDQERTLQGGIDELRNGLQQQNADLTKQIGDLTFRVQALEGGKPAVPPDGAPPGVAPGAAAPGPPIAAPKPVTHATLQQGYAALARRDYPAAEAAARDTLAAPHSPHAYDAHFLLAQSLAGQHNYQQAALAFDDSYKAQPRGSHAQDALIGLANSLTALGAKPAACATIEKLHEEFPGARPDIRASAAVIVKRAACG
jgi:TolA-binding protein